MRRFSYIVGLAVAAVLGAVSLAEAQDNAAYWNTTGPAPWATSSNWTVAPFGGGFYSTQQNATVINNGGTATIADGDNVGDVVAAHGSIFVGGSFVTSGTSGVNGPPGSSGYVTMTGGTLGQNSSQYWGEYLGDLSGSGVFSQSGGINRPYMSGGTAYNNFSPLAVGYQSGGYGQYDLSGTGSIGVNAIYVGGMPEVNEVEITVTTYGGTGVFNQTGGSVGSLGATNQPVGLFVGGEWCNRNVKGFTTSSSGIYNLSGANSLLVGGVETIGVNGTGTFTQDGGTNAVVGGGTVNGKINNAPYSDAQGFLMLGLGGKGTSLGTYNLNGGLLTGQDDNNKTFTAYGIVGVGGTGIFSQSGGTNDATSGLYVGGTWLAKNSLLTNSIGQLPTRGLGSYTLSGGVLITPDSEYIGSWGTGTFTQTGGSNTCRTLNLGGGDFLGSTPGTYTLAGGLLQTSQVSVPDVSDVTVCAFNFTGGTLQAHPILGLESVFVPVTFGTAASSVMTFDCNGQAVQLSSFQYGLNGPGQLQIVDNQGGGKFVFDSAGVANYTGGTKQSCPARSMDWPTLACLRRAF